MRSDVPTIEVSIDGQQVTPSAVSLGKLSSLLNGIKATFDALAVELEVAVQDLALVKVRKGSAAYEVQGTSGDFPEVGAAFCIAAAGGGRNNGPDVRRGLQQMERATRPYGPIKIGWHLIPCPKDMQPFYMPAPLAPDADALTYGTLLYGRIDGVFRQEEDGEVAIRLIEGGIRRLRAPWEVASRALQLFGETVRCDVEVTAAGGKIRSYSLLRIERWKEGDFLSALDRVREKIRATLSDADHERIAREFEE